MLGRDLLALVQELINPRLAQIQFLHEDADIFAFVVLPAEHHPDTRAFRFHLDPQLFPFDLVRNELLDLGLTGRTSISSRSDACQGDLPPADGRRLRYKPSGAVPE